MLQDGTRKKKGQQGQLLRNLLFPSRSLYGQICADTVNAIIKDLSIDLANEVNILGLMPWVAELDSLNIAFNQKYVQRAQSVSGYEPGIIVALISEATVAFRQMKAMFEARFAVAVDDSSAEVPEFQQTENEWSSITRQYNESVNRFAGNGGENEAQTAVPTEPEA